MSDQRNGAKRPFILAALSPAVVGASAKLQQAHADNAVRDQVVPGWRAEDAVRAEQLQVGNGEGNVLVVFDRITGFIQLTPEGAIELAAHLCANARAAGYPNVVGVVEQVQDAEPAADEQLGTNPDTKH